MIDELSTSATYMDERTVNVSCSTLIRGADDPMAIFDSLKNLFPELNIDELQDRPTGFPMPETTVQWDFTDLDMQRILDIIHDSRILDTALDAMSQFLKGDRTTFRLSRQAALSKKVSFCITDETPLGGYFTITIEGDDLQRWLEDATWHRGRQEIPRNVGDERSMSKMGEPSEWFS